MNDYKVICNQGSDYIVEATDPNNALELFGEIRMRRGLDQLNDFKVLDVELVAEERPIRMLNGVKVR